MKRYRIQLVVQICMKDTLSVFDNKNYIIPISPIYVKEVFEKNIKINKNSL